MTNSPLYTFEEAPEIKILSRNPDQKCAICGKRDFYYYAEDWFKVFPEAFYGFYICIKCYIRARETKPAKREGG